MTHGRWGFTNLFGARTYTSCQPSFDQLNAKGSTRRDDSAAFSRSDSGTCQDTRGCGERIDELDDVHNQTRGASRDRRRRHVIARRNREDGAPSSSSFLGKSRSTVYFSLGQDCMSKRRRNWAKDRIMVVHGPSNKSPLNYRGGMFRSDEQAAISHQPFDSRKRTRNSSRLLSHSKVFHEKDARTRVFTS